VAFYGCDGEVSGALAFGDRIKAGAADLIAGLKERGIRTLLLSGDAPARCPNRRSPRSAICSSKARWWP
jgi:cation transport ATPase